jgi:hypothetical protein
MGYRSQTHISTCSWPFFCVADAQSDDVKVGVGVEDARDVADWHLASISKRRRGLGRGLHRMTKMMNDIILRQGVQSGEMGTCG